MSRMEMQKLGESNQEKKMDQNKLQLRILLGLVEVSIVDLLDLVKQKMFAKANEWSKKEGFYNEKIYGAIDPYELRSVGMRVLGRSSSRESSYRGRLRN